MAVLDATNRARITAQAMRQMATEFGTVNGVLKADLAAAVDATDAWIDTNAALFNAALPTAFRTNATLVQKTLLFCYVAMRRAGLLKVNEDG